MPAGQQQQSKDKFAKDGKNAGDAKNADAQGGPQAQGGKGKPETKVDTKNAPQDKSKNEDEYH